MHQNSEALIHEQRVLLLAEQEVECPRKVRPLLLHDQGCGLCLGTDKALAFPMLWQKCPTCEGSGVETVWKDVWDASGNRTTQPAHHPCHNCAAETDFRRGCGWVPDASLGALLDAALGEFDVHFTRTPDGRVGVWLERDCEHDTDPETSLCSLSSCNFEAEGEKTEALSEALYKATLARTNKLP